MSRGQIIAMLALTLSMASAAWTQSETQQQPAPAPPPADQENATLSVRENPPISAIDLPGLEPHAAPESFLLMGLHFSESADSNVSNSLGGSSIGSVTRGLGSLTLQRLWKNYDVAMDYIGGVAYYHTQGVGTQQLQEFDIDNRINWKRGQLAIRDALSYLPEGTFGFGAYGGGGAYNIGLGGLGAGMLGAGAFGGQTNAFTGGAGGIEPGVVPRLNNVGLADVVESLTPKSAVTVAAGYALVHFYGALTSAITGQSANINFIGSREFTGQFGYDFLLSAKDQLAVSYGYQAFDFSTVGTAFHSSVIQGMYGHRVSGRMDFLISAGPQFTHISANETECTISFQGVQIPIPVPPGQCTAAGEMLQTTTIQGNHIGAAGRMLLRYRFEKTSVSLSFQRWNTNGSGIFAGAESNVASLQMSRRLGRVWNIFSDLGYAKNKHLQLPGATIGASSFSSGFGGAGLHRQFGRSLIAFASYQFNELGFSNDICPTGSALADGNCINAAGAALAGKPISNLSQRQVGTIGVDWTPRPRRLD